MAETGQDFELYAGNAGVISVTVMDEGAPADISTVADIIWRLARDTFTAPELVYRKIVPGQITFVSNGSDGRFQINIDTAATAALSGYYIHTAVTVDGSGNETTVATGRAHFLPQPAWTYSGDPATSIKDQVRFLIGDTNEADKLIFDTEIRFAVSVRGSAYGAAAAICSALAARFAREADISERELRTALSQRAGSYRALAKDYESKAIATAGVALGTITGLLRGFA